MKQTLIKITDDHYVVVDDSEIKKGDWFICSNEIHKCTGTYSLKVTSYVECKKGPCSIEICKKITHSTQPNKGMENITFISPRVVKELIGEVDVEKEAREEHEQALKRGGSEYATGYYEGLLDGYNQALEDNKDKKYTEMDMKKAFYKGVDSYMQNGDALDSIIHNFRQSLKPKTQWEVIFDEQGKLRLI